MYKNRNTETGNGMYRTRGMGRMLYSGECRRTFWGMSSKIPGNVVINSGECYQTFRGMSPNIHCCSQMMLSKGRLSKSAVGQLSMGRTFINLFNYLQSIWHRLKKVLLMVKCYYTFCQANHFMLWIVKLNMR